MTAQARRTRPRSRHEVPPNTEAEAREDTRTQAEKFEAAARELDCDPDEGRFKDVLRKLAKPSR